VSCVASLLQACARRPDTFEERVVHAIDAERLHLRQRLKTLLTFGALAGGVWCATANGGPYPFYQHLTADWLAGPWPPISALLCGLTILIPLRQVLAAVVRDRADAGDDTAARGSDWANPSRRREPVMFLGAAPADRVVETDQPSRLRGLASRLLTVLLILSVIEMIVGGLLWWRGQARADYIGWSGDGTHLGLLSEDGIVRLEYTDDETTPAGWRAISMDPSPRLRGWQSSWRGDLEHANRVGGAYGVAWQERRTSRAGYRFGDRTRRSLYLSHPFLVGVGLVLPLACVGWGALKSRKPDGGDVDFVV
jgi:hypothetical protein